MWIWFIFLLLLLVLWIVWTFISARSKMCSCFWLQILSSLLKGSSSIFFSLEKMDSNKWSHQHIVHNTIGHFLMNYFLHLKKSHLEHGCHRLPISVCNGRPIKIKSMWLNGTNNKKNLTSLLKTDIVLCTKTLIVFVILHVKSFMFFSLNDLTSTSWNACNHMKWKLK